MKTLRNSLGNSSSPYLKQHKDNPVYWQEWSDKTLELAKELDRPLFISIGYSSCHWCHVMAHESFEDAEIAENLNEQFINIKVDREERPDIDAIYMTATQMMTGSGGWPLSIFAFPDGRAFYCGTYFPPKGRFGRPGFLELLQRIIKQWNGKRDLLLDTGNKIVEKLSEESAFANKDGNIDEKYLLKKCYDKLCEEYDYEYHGFGKRPKFPSPQKLIFLKNYYELLKNNKEEKDNIAAMLLRTHHAMAAGGIHDHLGGGFHRYATDQYWLLPHFEKMLYDQAMLLWSFSEITDIEKEYGFEGLNDKARTGIIRFINNELESNNGSFYSALDADTSEGEGKYYLWNKNKVEEIEKRLYDDLEAPKLKVSDYFNLKNEGNFLEEATGELTGENILHTLGNDFSTDIERENPRYDEIIEVMGKIRSSREKPMLDDKVLTDWNALMYIGLFEYYSKNDRKYLKTLANNLFDNIIDNNNNIKHVAGGIDVSFLDDYAFLIYAGLKYLPYADNYYNNLSKILNLYSTAISNFYSGYGEFYINGKKSSLIARPESGFDSAYPSGLSFMYGNSVLLWHLTGENRYMEVADQIIRKNYHKIEQYPVGYSMMLSFIAEEQSNRRTIVIFGSESSIDLVRDYCQSSDIILPISSPELHRQLKASIDWLPEWIDKEAAYICQGFACDLPILGMENIINALV